MSKSKAKFCGECQYNMSLHGPRGECPSLPKIKRFKRPHLYLVVDNTKKAAK